MHALAAVVAAGLLGAVALPGGPGDARVEAGAAIYDLATGTYRLEGGVVVARGAVRLRARSARWDPRSGAIDAAGGVLLTDATRAISAEGIHALVDGDFEAHGVVAFLKSGPAGLDGATTPAEAAACGRNALTARAAEVRSGAGGTLTLDGARVTPCDCEVGPPSWELRAARATVHPGETVELSWPVLWVTPRFLFVDRPVPVLAIPWISLPLGERVSGLLAPQVGTSGVTGITAAQPYFLVLGRSADLTLTPRYAFGRSRADVAAGKPSVRGAGGSLEGRWTPVPGAAGRLQADLLWDTDDERADSPLHGADGARGLRLALTGGWAQRFSEATSLRADLDLVGDSLYVRDFTSDVLLRDATVRRSTALLERRGEAVVVEASAAWLEPVSRAGTLAGVDGGLFGGKLTAFHRWPGLSATLLPVALAGPLRLSGRAGLSRFAPPNGATSDGGVDGVGPGERPLPPASVSTADLGELDGRWQVGERLAATRADLRAELTAPFTLGDWVSVLPSLRAVALGYAFDAARDPLAQAWGSAGVVLSTGLSRRWGELRHAVEPRLEWRATSGVAGPGLPAFGYDGWDRGAPVPSGAAASLVGQRLAAAAPPGALDQLRLSVATRLTRGAEELLRAEAGQEVDLRRGALAEGFLRAAATRGPVSGEVDMRFWTTGRLVLAPAPPHASWLDSFSELRLRLAVADPRGDELRASLLAVGAGGSGRLGAGADDLFDPRPAGAVALASASLAARLRAGPALFAYEVLLPARSAVLPACQGSGTGTRSVGPWEVQQHTGSIEWDSPCHCFRARVVVRVDGCGDFGGSLSFDLGQAAGLGGR